MLAIPFLPSLFPENVYAAPVTTPLKFVQVASPFHADRGYYWPEKADRELSVVYDSNLASYTQLDKGFRAGALAEIIASTKRGTNYNGQISLALDKNWNALAPYMNLITGLGMIANNEKHNATAATTASLPNMATAEKAGHAGSTDPRNPYSLDWFAEQYLNKVGAAPVFSALRMNLAYRHGQGYLHGEHNCYTFRGKDTSRGSRGQALHSPEMHDIAELELKLKNVGAANLDTRTISRRGLIDGVLADYNRILNHRRISSVDKERLSNAVELWHQAEARRTAGSTMACDLSALSRSDRPQATDATRASWEIYNNYTMDLLAAALHCGLTRVVTYVLSHAGVASYNYDIDDKRPPIPVKNAELYTGHDSYLAMHAHAHSNSNYHEIGKSMAMFRAARMAHFANRLRELKDENGLSLLESTLMYWGFEYAESGHNNIGTTSILIGKAGGRLQTGLHIDGLGAPVKGQYSRYFPNVSPLNKVHITVLRALGLTQEQIEAPTGTVGFGEYDLVKYDGNEATKYSNDHRTNGVQFGTENVSQWLTIEEKRKPIPILKT